MSGRGADGLYVGLANTFHDSSLAIVDARGELLFAEAAERPLQYKRASNVSADLVGYVAQVLRSHCEPPSDLTIATCWTDVVHREASLISNWHDTSERTAGELFGHTPDFLIPLLAYRRYALASQLRSTAMAGRTLALELSRMPGWQRTAIHSREIDHHLTHAATACFTSPHDEAVCAVVDGHGERHAVGFFGYRDGRLEPIPSRQAAAHPGSLGFFYQTLCEACGFDYVMGEEWKVMGLAAYGHFDAELHALMKEMVSVKDLCLEACDERRELLLRKRLYELGPHGTKARPAADIACTGQVVFTELLMQLLGNLQARGISRNLVLTGGCALNSSANGKVLGAVPFQNIHVFCAPADDGNSVGAALLACQEDHPGWRPEPRIQSPYLGARLSSVTLDNLKRFGGFAKLTHCVDDTAPLRGAELLAQGKILGWIQGRAEFGPRALGNRSILADPRSPGIKDEINRRVKFREEFRPFAASILHERGPAYFEHYQESPYMDRTLRFRPDVTAKVPGVVHVDGSGRLQTVKREWNPSFHQLIAHFDRLTGIPLVLNTSFNVMGKPIAHSVEDAIAVFATTGIDALFLDDVLIEK